MVACRDGRHHAVAVADRSLPPKLPAHALTKMDQGEFVMNSQELLDKQ